MSNSTAPQGKWQAISYSEYQSAGSIAEYLNQNLNKHDPASIKVVGTSLWAGAQSFNGKITETGTSPYIFVYSANDVPAYDEGIRGKIFQYTTIPRSMDQVLDLLNDLTARGMDSSSPVYGSAFFAKVYVSTSSDVNGNKQSGSTTESFFVAYYADRPLYP